MSNSSLSALLDQKAELEKQIANIQRQERSDAISQVKSLMTQYGLSLADIGGRAPPSGLPRAGSKVAAKYRDQSTGDSWSGRGLKPKWLQAALASGKSLADFAV